MADIVTVGELTTLARNEVKAGGDRTEIVARLNKRFDTVVAEAAEGVCGVQIRHVPSGELIDLTLAFDQS